MKLAIVPELQSQQNKQVNRGLHTINVILFVLVTASIVVGLATYRNIHHPQNITISGFDGGVIGTATLLVPNWAIVPAKIGQDARLLLPSGIAIPAALIRNESLHGIDVALLKADGIPTELMLNAANLAEDAGVYIQDNGTEWSGRLRKAPEGLYTPTGDRQFTPGVPVTSDRDHSTVVGIVASGQSGSVVISIEELQQVFPELR